MKYILAVITAVFMFTNVAHAETTERNVVQSVVTHHYITETIQHRISNRVCNEVDVPIYGNNGKAQTGEVLGGAIIGGILGNQVGGGKGKDAATLSGAIVGADLSNKKGKSKQVIVGHKQQEVCDVVMQQRSVSQVTGYKTYIEFGGNVWQMTTTIPYTTGEFLSVNVDITPAE